MTIDDERHVASCPTCGAPASFVPARAVLVAVRGLCDQVEEALVELYRGDHVNDRDRWRLDGAHTVLTALLHRLGE